MRPLSTVRRLLATLLAAFALTTNLRAENLPADHPTAELVKKYFVLVVEQNWREAAKMIRPSSIERKKRETMAIIKSAQTMSEEAAMLAKLGIKDVRELEKMSNEDFYVADRQSFHNPAKTDADVQKQKLASLKVNVLGIVGEQDGKVAHLAVRTSQDVIDQRIDELFFISFVQDEQSKAWLIAPDMQRPATSPLNGAAPAEGAAPAPAADPKAKPAADAAAGKPADSSNPKAAPKAKGN